jgi:hypothetical protein
MAKKRVRSKESRAKHRATEHKNRRERRARARIEKLTVPREGACEEVVARMVSKVVTVVKAAAQKRRLARERRVRLKLTDPDALKAKNKKFNASRKKEMDRLGLQQRELIAKKREMRKDKPSHNAADYRKQRYATDEQFTIRCRLSVRLRETLSASGLAKDGRSIVELFGAPTSFVRDELLATGSKEGLAIASSDIDHIFPISRYDLKTEAHKANHWTNLRLCDPVENKKKHNALPSLELALMVDRDCWPASVSVADLL